MNMKIKILAVGAAVAAFTLTSFAAEPLLSPRAAGNQIKVASNATETPAITVTYVQPTSALLSPRAAGNQIKVVKGIANDANPVLECRNNMIGSPRVVAECSSHTTMPMCMTVAPLK